MNKKNNPTIAQFQAMSFDERAEFLHSADLTGTEMERAYAHSIPRSEAIVVALLWQQLCDRDGCRR